MVVNYGSMINELKKILIYTYMWFKFPSIQITLAFRYSIIYLTAILATKEKVSNNSNLRSYISHNHCSHLHSLKLNDDFSHLSSSFTAFHCHSCHCRHEKDADLNKPVCLHIQVGLVTHYFRIKNLNVKGVSLHLDFIFTCSNPYLHGQTLTHTQTSIPHA